MSSRSDLLTEEEIHSLGVQLVARYLDERGSTIVSTNLARLSNPQIVAHSAGQLTFIVVRSAFFPQQGELESPQMVRSVISHAAASGAICILATVQFANPDGHTDVERSIPIKGGGMAGMLTSFLELHNPEDYRPARVSYGFDKSGSIGSYFELLPEEGDSGEQRPFSDYNSSMMALYMRVSDSLTLNERTVLSRWAGLPSHSWTNSHRHFFGLAFMHYLYLVREHQSPVSSELAKAASLLEPGQLPPLPRRLNSDMITLFDRLHNQFDLGSIRWVRKPPLDDPQAVATVAGETASREVSWNDLDPIWDKWTHAEIPEAAEKACNAHFLVTIAVIQALDAEYVEKGVLGSSVQASEKRGQNLGKAVGSSSRMSYMLGLESGQSDIPPSLLYEIEPTRKEFPKLMAAAQPTRNLTAYYLGIVISAGFMNEDVTKALGEEMLRSVWKGAIGCFRVGLEYSTLNRVGPRAFKLVTNNELDEILRGLRS